MHIHGHYFANSFNTSSHVTERGKRFSMQFPRSIFLVMIIFCSFMLGTVVQIWDSSSSQALELHISSTTDETQHSNARIVQEPKQIVVQSGDTLWEIAVLYAPKSMNLHAYVHELKRINQLESPFLYIGQRLILPD